MTAPRTTVEIERETAELALRRLTLTISNVATKQERGAWRTAIADLRRALAEGEKRT